MLICLVTPFKSHKSRGFVLGLYVKDIIILVFPVLNEPQVVPFKCPQQKHVYWKI